MTEAEDRAENCRGWLRAIAEVGRNLTKWEEGFVEEMADQLDGETGWVSEKQAGIIERIYSDRTP